MERRIEKELCKRFYSTDSEGTLKEATPFLSEKGIYHYFYLTEDLTTGKFYCGIHATRKLNDRYLGSGTLLRRAVKKRGETNFKKTIIRFFKNHSEACLFESTVICDEFLIYFKDYSMNLVKGGGALEKDVVWMKDPEGKCYRVSKVLVDEYKKKGFKVEGTSTGFVGVSKKGTYTTVPKDKLSEYLSEGWIRGGKESSLKGKKAIFNPLTKDITVIDPKDLSFWKEKGWQEGYPCWMKEQASKIHKGRVRITNGIKTKNVWPEEVDTFLSQGWVKGSSLKNTEGRKMMYKGPNRIRAKKEDIQKYLEEGWSFQITDECKNNLAKIRKEHGTDKESKLKLKLQLND